MAWTVLFHREFNTWFDDLDSALQDEIFALVGVLEEFGPQLGRPRVDSVKGSAFSNMKELRVQFKGEPWRILFAFDPKRRAIMLLVGNKTGHDRWYQENVPIADERFRRYLASLGKGEDEQWEGTRKNR
jgi:hypothetical protein